KSLIEESIESVANFVNSVNKNVDFLVDEDSGRTVIKIIDVKSQELIRQFPSDEIISMATRIKELQEQISSKTGLFLDESV
ncbi:MAG: flagellar protein FlaG, partial [Colwellia sp.]|nr:flagellar protein FlaG [Colwellia sp.]